MRTSFGGSSELGSSTVTELTKPTQPNLSFLFLPYFSLYYLPPQTFGMKNKNKSAKVQRTIAEINRGQERAGKNKETLAKEAEKEAREKAKLIDLERKRQEAALFRPTGLVQPKLAFGQDPKSVMCVFFKNGLCEKGESDETGRWELQRGVSRPIEETGDKQRSLEDVKVIKCLLLVILFYGDSSFQATSASSHTTGTSNEKPQKPTSTKIPERAKRKTRRPTPWTRGTKRNYEMSFFQRLVTLKRRPTSYASSSSKRLKTVNTDGSGSALTEWIANIDMRYHLDSF